MAKPANDAALSCRRLDVRAQTVTHCRGTTACLGALNEYEMALRSFGPMRDHDGASESGRCRLKMLGDDLCKTARAFLGGTGGAVQRTFNASHLWSAWMRELSMHETDEGDCQQFYRFHSLEWNPRVFSWQEGSRSAAPFFAGSVYQHGGARYEQLYSAAVERDDYGPPELRRSCALVYNESATRQMRKWNLVRPLPCPPADEVAATIARSPRDDVPRYMTFRHAQSVDASHFLVLREATGLEPRLLSRIVECGAGAGELAGVVRDLGFEGAHIIYDLPPMLMMQRYWHRYSGLPSYLLGADLLHRHHEPAGVGFRGAPLGSHFGPPDDLLAGRVALVSSLDPLALPLALEHSRASTLTAEATDRNTLFVATWSFSEASLSAREAIRHRLKPFGRLLVAFWDSFDGIDNSRYLREWVASDLHASHLVCVWRMGGNKKTAYLLAVQRDLVGARLNCVREAGCTNASKVPGWSALQTC